MRYREVWSNPIGVGLFVVSLLFLVMRVSLSSGTDRDRLIDWMQLVGTSSLAVSVGVGAITARIKQSRRFGAILLLGTFCGFITGFTVCPIVFLAIMGIPIILVNILSSGDSSIASALESAVLFLGWLTGGIWGGLDCFLWYSRRQQRRGVGRSQGEYKQP